VEKYNLNTMEDLDLTKIEYVNGIIGNTISSDVGNELIIEMPTKITEEANINLLKQQNQSYQVKKHTPVIINNEPIYIVEEGIKIYDGTTSGSRIEYKNKIEYLNNITNSTECLFSDLQPSTLTAQGIMSNIGFDEKLVIDSLSKPTGHMLMIGCNYGEKFNDRYLHPSAARTSGRGRKPKPKVKSRRKVQGNGKYFSSQITFLIEHPDLLDPTKEDTPANHAHYKIKLFRNGVFQVPGIRDPSMLDLVKPIRILREYLEYNFAEDVQVMKFTAVMRNYKACLLNKYYHVNLEKLEEIILREKTNSLYQLYVDYMLLGMVDTARDNVKLMLSNFNPMNIAEMTYNTDRCFCLIIKFYRPSLFDPNKKTTVKLLKKGKINFDGGNSEQEIKELYAWIEYIYTKHHKQILFDIRDIVNTNDDSSSECDEPSIYDAEPDDEDGDGDSCDKSSCNASSNTSANYEENKESQRDPGDIIMKALRQPTNRPIIGRKVPPKKPFRKIED
jgi:hypothetical protein